MFNRIFFIVGSFMIAANATASIEPKKAPLIHAQSRALEHSITLHNVRGHFHDVTGVTIQIQEKSIDLELNYLGHHSWEARLTPAQVNFLLGTEKAKTFDAKLIVRSKNDKQRYDTQEEEIQFTLNQSSGQIEQTL